MEGPSLFLAQEQLRPFKGRRIKAVSGNTKIGKERFKGKKVEDIFSWGKHLVFQFDTFAFRVHFLLFGSFTATVKGASVTGDYKKAREPRLALTFPNGSIEMYSCSIKIFEDPALKRSYDYSIDIMSPQWDPKAAIARLRERPEREIADVLLDQAIFAGVGNIIKNEILWLTGIHPQAQIKQLTSKQIRSVVAEARSFSRQFYEWRKVFLLRKSLRIYQKGQCPICASKVVRGKTGLGQRWTFYCPRCQAAPKRPKRSLQPRSIDKTPTSAAARNPRATTPRSSSKARILRSSGTGTVRRSPGKGR